MKNRWEWHVLDNDESKSFLDQLIMSGSFNESDFWDAQEKMEKLFYLSDDYDDLKRRFGDDANLDGEWIEELGDGAGDYSRSCFMERNGFTVKLFTMNYNYDPHPHLNY